MATDQIFLAQPVTAGSFRFDEAVARVFPDMIRRSVPGYRDMVAMTGVIAGQYASPGSTLYDLGCSLGASTLAMRHAVEGRDCRIIGIDNAPAMLSRAQATLAADSATTPVTLMEADICGVDFVPASLMAMNFTLQFIPPAARLPLLTRIAEALQPEGVLVLSEKIRFEDAVEQACLTDLHHAFKAAQGYSQLEISRKRTSLEAVLVPDSLAEHQARLRAAGFARVICWHQSFSFVSLLAFRA